MKLLRRILIALVGGTVLLVGVAMIVLPGPAIIVIPAGLAILGIEFAWARHWLHKSREFIARRLPGKGPMVKSEPALPPSSPVQKIDNAT